MNELSLAPLPSRNAISDDVYAVLRQGVLNGQFEPGTKLNLDALARRLHVSNTPVRQALTRLVGEGLVTLEPYRGFTVSSLLDMHGIQELFDYRLIVEPATAGIAARRRSVDHLRILESLCDPDHLKGLFTPGSSNGVDLAERDRLFHTTIASATGNSMLQEFSSQALSRIQVHSMYADPVAGNEAWVEHREIMKAISAGDATTASTTMRAHLRNSLSRMQRRTAGGRHRLRRPSEP